MKANNLVGDYCQTCASLLDDAQRNFRPVVILDSQCAQVFHQSGDAARFNAPVPEAPPAVLPEPKIHGVTPKAPVHDEEPRKPHKKTGGKKR